MFKRQIKYVITWQFDFEIHYNTYIKIQKHECFFFLSFRGIYVIQYF